MQMLQSGVDASVEVTFDDQKRINEFSKMCSNYFNLQQEIEKRNSRKEFLTDSLNEVEMCELNDEESIKYKIGDAFFDLDVDDAKSRIECDLEQNEQDISDLTNKIMRAKKELKELQSILYAKSKNQINLEFE